MERVLQLDLYEVRAGKEVFSTEKRVHAAEDVVSRTISQICVELTEEYGGQMPEAKWLESIQLWS